MTTPFFSVMVSAYNREREIGRSVASALAQSERDLEVVVVDDGSRDATAEVVESIGDGRVRLIRHPVNRGISTARATAVSEARGEWLVTLDSDDELVPGGLARLRELIEQLPDDVLVIRARLRGDGGNLQPGIVPDGTTDYEGRLRWLEQVMRAGVSTDAAHCMHRSVYDLVPMLVDRRGGLEALWELELARRVRSRWDEQVLILQHDDAANSHTRDADVARLMPRMLSEAPDVLWMCETLLTDHREGLDRWAPFYRYTLQRIACTEAFLSGRRAAGIRHARDAWRSRQGGRPAILATVVLGVTGSRVLGRAKATGRMLRTRLAVRG